MACEFDGGVVIGADSRATTGYDMICLKLFFMDVVIIIQWIS